jgi:hypothetical protein
VNPDQLEALVRRAGKDKEINLTILRGGNEQKITARIGEKMLPERRAIPGMGAGRMNPLVPGERRGDFNLRGLPSRGDAGAEGERRDGDRQVRYARENAHIVRSDEEGRFELRSTNGSRIFSAQKPNGEPAWSGPVETPAQREAVPPELRKKLEILTKEIERNRAPGQPPQPPRPPQPPQSPQPDRPPGEPLRR